MNIFQHGIFESILDPDAINFINRASLSTPSQIRALNTLTISLKRAGIWNKIFAVWPIIGGNAIAHSKNLKSDSFNITWQNSPTHDNTGVSFNGINQYGDTNLSASNVVWNNATLACYINVAGSSNAGLMVAQDDVTTDEFLLSNFPATNEIFFNVGDYGGRSSSVPNVGNNGFFAGSRSSDSDMRVYQNGAVISAASGPGAAATPNLNLYLGAYDYMGSAALFFNGKFAFSMVTQNLSTAEHAILYKIVQNFQISLGRNV